jgi:hypothetical protein
MFRSAVQTEICTCEPRLRVWLKQRFVKIQFFFLKFFFIFSDCFDMLYQKLNFKKQSEVTFLTQNLFKGRKGPS